MSHLTKLAAIAAVVLPFSGANAAVLTVGNGLARSCYEAASGGGDSRAFATESCTRALAEEGLDARDRAATFVNRGILNMIGGRDAEADADFDAALAMNRNIPDAWLNKGFLRLRQNDPRDALQMLETGIKLNPQRRALAIFARGVAYEQMGDLRSAYTDIRQAHQLEPGWALPKQYLAHYRVDR
jgi:tetratricopeptide (TPR) repeat protein